MKTWNTCTCSKLTMQCHCFHHGMLCCSGSVLTWTWLPVLVRTLYIYIRLDLLIDDPVRPDALHHIVELLLLLLSPVHHFFLVVVPYTHVQAVVIRRGTYSQITSCLQIEKKTLVWQRKITPDALTVKSIMLVIQNVLNIVKWSLSKRKEKPRLHNLNILFHMYKNHTYSKFIYYLLHRTS